MRKILNFGSMNLDFVYEVEHFVRAGETISSLSLKKFLGGKGLNQSVALARAGAEVYHAGVIGSDGAAILEMFRKNGVDITHIRQCETPTGNAIIQKDTSGQNCIILYGGANQCVTHDDIERALSGFEAGDYILLQNEINEADEIIRAAKVKNMLVALNPSPMDMKILEMPLELVDIFILNEIEAAGLSGSENESGQIRALKKKYPHAAFVMTLGKHGVRYWSGEGSDVLSHGIYKVPVVDTTAAGDTFTGYFLAGVLHGRSAEKSLELASIASSIAVSRQGAEPSIPTLEEVLNSKLALV